MLILIKFITIKNFINFFKIFVAYKYFFDLYETLNVADKLIKFLYDTKIYFLIKFLFFSSNLISLSHNRILLIKINLSGKVSISLKRYRYFSLSYMAN